MNYLYRKITYWGVEYFTGSQGVVLHGKPKALKKKEVRTKEMIFRNWHATQMSGNKKRRQFVDFEEHTALRERHVVELTVCREENECRAELQ